MYRWIKFGQKFMHCCYASVCEIHLNKKNTCKKSVTINAFQLAKGYCGNVLITPKLLQEINSMELQSIRSKISYAYIQGGGHGFPTVDESCPEQTTFLKRIMA